MIKKTKKLPKIEDECQMANRMEKRFLKSLNDEIFDAFMERHAKLFLYEKGKRGK